MKYYYLNKVAMAVLLALLLFFGTRTLIDIMYEEHEPATPGYEVAGGEEESAEGGKAKGADKGAAFIAALNKADPAKGEQDVGLCKVCHSFEKGGPNMIGPDLYGVVGHKIASHEGFNYTPALKGHEGEWTFENLNHWLENPQAFASGTSMAFPGIPDLQKRADVIAYLNKNSDKPLPIPEPVAEPASDEGGEAADKEASAGGGAHPVLGLLADADPAKGEQAAALCKVCHTFDAGGANMVGPNLHNVVGAEVGHHKDFSYTAALKDKGGSWTYERLDEWLSNPQAFAAGTTMAFPGIPDAKKRADVIAFLRSETDNPPPLPSGDAEAAPAEKAAPAEEAAPAADEAKPEEEAAPADEAKPAEEAAPAKDEAKPAEEAAPAADEAKPEEEAAPAEDEAKPAEEAAPAADEAKPAEEAAPAADEAKPEEEAAPAEEPAAEQPAAEEPAATEAPAADDAAAGAEDAKDETVVVSPEVSADAPTEPHKGEDPSPNQPQPVYPDDGTSTTTRDDAQSDAAPAADQDGTSSQPQPVYPDGKPEDQ